MTAAVESLERRVAALTARLDLIDGAGGMLDTTRRVVGANFFKVETGGDTPHLITNSETGNLDLGSGNIPVVRKITQAASHTGDLLETTIATLTVQADEMGINGNVCITSIWNSVPSGPGTTEFSIYFGQVIAANLIGFFVATSGTGLDSRVLSVWNKNATNAQSALDQAPIQMNLHSGITGVIINLTEDTTSDVDIFFRVKNSKTGATASLEFAKIEIFRSDS